jgi:AAA domain, putative AbiEii toxin, Type IV TA system
VGEIGKGGNNSSAFRLTVLAIDHRNHRLSRLRFRMRKAMSVVKTIEFNDYKAFPRFTISARKRNVLVGPNNAGKSTTLDSFRIAADVIRYITRRNAMFKSHDNHGVCSTWTVPASVIQIDLRSCIHNFGEGPAEISIKLENGNILKIIIFGEGDLECYLITEATARKNTAFLRENFPLSLIIVPTLSPLEQIEDLVSEETVERNKFGRLASRNFRNFWLHKTQQEFDEFADLVEYGWPGVKLMRPERVHGQPKPYVQMFFRDKSAVREVQWAGFGFQVWMQTMMHLFSATPASTLILDEPDIYLHPDLQHRLLNLINDRFDQYFIATHSTEIINRVEPGDVLIVRPGSRGAKRIQTEAGYADVYSAIGSSENAQFARLAKTKRVLYFEGNDHRILSNVVKKVAGRQFLSRGSTTVMKTDGFSNWSRVSNSSWVFKNFFGFEIPVAAIFDRDYRSDSEINEFLLSVNNADTCCRVWPFKEIENMLLVPQAIEAIVEEDTKQVLPGQWKQTVSAIFAESYDSIKSQTLSARIGAKIRYEVGKRPGTDIPTIAAEEEKNFSKEWLNNEFKKKVSPGKQVLSEVSRLVQSEFKLSISASRITDKLKRSDIDPEVFKIIDDIQGHLKDAD